MSDTNVEARLLAEPVRRLDLSEFCLVTADTTVRKTIVRMRATNNHCAFIVGEGTHIVGILTDRDVLKRIVSHPETWDQPVSEVMTASPDTLSATATTNDALDMMATGHYRNVPVMDDDALVGNVTHFAVIKFLTEHFPGVFYNLPPEPENYADQRDGG
jgi:CBS domain-containing protein